MTSEPPCVVLVLVSGHHAAVQHMNSAWLSPHRGQELLYFFFHKCVWHCVEGYLTAAFKANLACSYGKVWVTGPD